MRGTKHRTPAERKADKLSREVGELKRLRRPTASELHRLRIAERELETAWRVVHDMRRGAR